MTGPGGLPVRRARAWLTRTFEPGSGALFGFVDEHGPVEAARLIQAGAAPPELVSAASSRRGQDHAAADLAAVDRLGGRLVTPEDDEWPEEELHAMAVATARGCPDLAPPLALWVRGPHRIDDALSRCVSIVGSRAATGSGQQVASEIGYGLAERGWTVVSGGAYGIDGAAHRGALAAGGVTVAIMAGGLEVPYPVGHTALFERIIGEGLLISEWPPDSSPQRHRFLIRNRLIAAVSAGTVVVEAGLRSGAAVTARRARELGRAQLAVPGPVTSAMSVGTHLLIRECEARLVTCAEHVLEEVGRLGDDLAPLPVAEPTARDRLTPVAQRVLDGLPACVPASVERIAAESGVPVLDVLRCLPALELAGLVAATAAGWRLTSAARAPRSRIRTGGSW